MVKPADETFWVFRLLCRKIFDFCLNLFNRQNIQVFYFSCIHFSKLHLYWLLSCCLFFPRHPCSFCSVMPVLGLDSANNLPPLSSGFLLSSAVGNLEGDWDTGGKKGLPLSYLLLYYKQSSERASYLEGSLTVTLQRYHQQLSKVSSQPLLRSKSQMSEFLLRMQEEPAASKYALCSVAWAPASCGSYFKLLVLKTSASFLFSSLSCVSCFLQLLSMFSFFLYHPPVLARSINFFLLIYLL